MNTLKVEYDVYAKLFGHNLIKLNLTVCENSKISISIPIIINENIDIYNSSSGYYNDICYTSTSEDGTDILKKNLLIMIKLFAGGIVIFQNIIILPLLQDVHVELKKIQKHLF